MFKFFETIAQGKEKLFYRYLDNDNQICELTYNDYAADIYEAFNNLNRMFSDIRGKHIGVLSNRVYDSMVLLAAANLGKAVVVPINQFESPDNIEYIIDNADIEILIVSDAYKKYHATFTVSVSEIVTCSRKERFEYDNAMDEFSDDNYMIVYTSGTTGKAKGVVIPFENIKNLVQTNTDDIPELLENATSMYLTIPLYHIMGIYYWIGAVYTGWIMHATQNFGDMLHELTIFNPNIVIATPGFIKMLEAAIKRGRDDIFGNLKYIISGGATLSESLADKLVKLGITVLDGYGMTETAAAGTLNRDALAHPGSIGKPLPYVNVRIVDGEMCIETKYNMKGYYKNEAATAECLIDGMVHTGDLAYIDEEGYVFITGRKKNLIILSGGENVSPEEIEKKLYENKYIKECKVFAKNDRIYAGIFANVEHQEEIRAFITELNSSLPIFKRINKVEFQESEFEKTANGKIKR